jgi:hypothetical protein
MPLSGGTSREPIARTFCGRRCLKNGAPEVPRVKKTMLKQYRISNANSTIYFKAKPT